MKDAEVENFFWRLSHSPKTKALWLEFARGRSLRLRSVNFRALGDFSTSTLIDCFQSLLSIPSMLRMNGQAHIEDVFFLSLDSPRELFLEDLHTLEKTHERLTKGRAAGVQRKAD